MPDDEQFERELGDRIRSYAASGDRPVDPRVVVARATGPRQTPGSGGGRFTTILGAAAGILVVLVTLSIGVLIASGAFGTRTPVGASPSPFPSAIASTPIVSPSPSVEPSPSETAAPTAPPATATPPSDSPSATLPTAPPPTTTPSASASATPSGSAIPAAFAPRSVTFVSPDDGFVLGAVPCASGSCPAIARTADAGHTWTAVPAPATTIAAPTPDGAPADAGVATIRFADTDNGWVFGPDLWSTHDGGQTWTRIGRAAVGGAVLALETARGTTHAVVDNGQGDFVIATSPVAGDDFTASGVSLPVGAGPVPELQLVLSGDAGWVLQNDRTVVNGARLRNGTWSAWKPVCTDVVGPAYLAASSATDLVAACDVGLWAGPKGGHLYISTDGGATAAASGTQIPGSLAGQIASGTADSAVVVVGGTDSTLLEATFDRGRTWTTVLDFQAMGVVDLGFTTADQGVMVAIGNDGSGRFSMTRDGGHTWQPITF
jgi:photosystem II stability/assembly factor-like uncharacterized protein